MRHPTLLVFAFAFIVGCEKAPPPPETQISKWVNEEIPRMESLADRAKKILKDAKAIELVFLVPDENYGPPNKEPGAEYLDWWKVTGRVPLDKAKHQEIAGRLTSDLEANWRDGLTDCFEPRHGLRVITDEGSFDLVLCFHCTQMWCFDESGTRLQSQTGISRDLQPILDALKTPDVDRKAAKRGLPE